MTQKRGGRIEPAALFRSPPYAVGRWRGAEGDVMEGLLGSAP
ncbi:hypothetical protein HMPREF0185_00780 [Brevundimonas diminuta 470-4]|nr:hypothetical protein HMPREF0185_00780 [Brevundimonas diminuta 470-4]